MCARTDNTGGRSGSDGESEAAPANQVGFPASKRYVLGTCSSGLCNRLLALAGSLRVAELTGREFLLYWPKNEALGSPFHHLFTNPYRMFTERDFHYLMATGVTLKTYNAWRVRDPLYEAIAADGDPEVEIVLIKAWYYPKRSNDSFDDDFFDAVRPYLRALKVRADLAEAASTFGLPEKTIGVHIRRDEKCAEFTLSSDEHFRTIMEALVAEDPGVSFFLATDHAETEQRFVKRFGDRVLTLPKRAGGRHCEPGMEEALVDLLVLSRTRGILGTHYSSFSHTASMLGNGVHITAKEKSAVRELASTVAAFRAGLDASPSDPKRST